MVVCHCRRVNDRTIAELAARYPATLEEISGRCGAGTDCGGCLDLIQSLLDDVARPAVGAGAFRRLPGPAPRPVPVAVAARSWNERLAG